MLTSYPDLRKLDKASPQNLRKLDMLPGETWILWHVNTLAHVSERAQLVQNIVAGMVGNEDMAVHVSFHRICSRTVEIHNITSFIL